MIADTFRSMTADTMFRSNWRFIHEILKLDVYADCAVSNEICDNKFTLGEVFVKTGGGRYCDGNYCSNVVGDGNYCSNIVGDGNYCSNIVGDGNWYS